MIKINYKIQFVFFVICLFFIGIGIYETLDERLKTGTDLFWQISHFVPFVMGAIIFGINIYSKRIENFKN
jgi:Na+/glutamate symporter